MKPILRRKKQPTTFERAAGFVKLGAKGLAAQRVARRAAKSYRFTKRAVPLAGLAAIGAVVAKKLRGGGDEAGAGYASASGTTSGGFAAGGTTSGSSGGGASGASAGGTTSGTESGTGASGTASGTGASGDASATAAASAATGTPPVGDEATPSAPAVGDAVVSAAGDKEAAAPGVGDESGTGEVAATKSSSRGRKPPSAAAGASDTPPPADASRTEEALGIEGPNQSTPPPPESTPTP